MARGPSEWSATDLAGFGSLVSSRLERPDHDGDQRSEREACDDEERLHADRPSILFEPCAVDRMASARRSVDAREDVGEHGIDSLAWYTALATQPALGRAVIAARARDQELLGFPGRCDPREIAEGNSVPRRQGISGCDFAPRKI